MPFFWKLACSNCALILFGDFISKLLQTNMNPIQIWVLFKKTIFIFHSNLSMIILTIFLQFLSILGATAYDSVRSLSYQEADVFLVCYKISDPISLYNVKNKWIGEIRRHRPEAPVVLCGCQSDLRYVYLDCADVGNLLAY